MRVHPAMTRGKLVQGKSIWIASSEDCNAISVLHTRSLQGFRQSATAPVSLETTSSVLPLVRPSTGSASRRSAQEPGGPPFQNCFPYSHIGQMGAPHPFGYALGRLLRCLQEWVAIRRHNISSFHYPNIPMPHPWKSQGWGTHLSGMRIQRSETWATRQLTLAIPTCRD
jgi:hypothetical protein